MWSSGDVEEGGGGAPFHSPHRPPTVPYDEVLLGWLGLVLLSLPSSSAPPTPLPLPRFTVTLPNSPSTRACRDTAPAPSPSLSRSTSAQSHSPPLLITGGAALPSARATVGLVFPLLTLPPRLRFGEPPLNRPPKLPTIPPPLPLLLLLLLSVPGGGTGMERDEESAGSRDEK